MPGQSEPAVARWTCRPNAARGRRQSSASSSWAPARGGVEQVADLFRIGTKPTLADAETRVVQRPAPTFANAPEHARGAIGVVLLEPVGEQLIERRGEAQEHPARAA